MPAQKAAPATPPTEGGTMRTAFLAFTISLALSLETLADVTFSGSVHSAAGAVAGAEVRATIYDRFTPNDRTDFVGATDAEGKFSIQLPQPSSGTIGGRPESALQVRVTASQQSGLLPETIESDFSGDVEARFVLHRPVRMSGRVSPAAPTVELFSLTTNRSYQVNGSSGTFDVQVVPDLYAVQAFIRGAVFSYGRTMVDGRAGDVTNIDLRLSSGDDAFHRALWGPPNAARITVSPPNDDGIATIAGAAGATHPSSAVLVANLETLQINLTASREDGSFSAPMFAPYGSNILVKHDPTGRFLPRLNFGGTINEVAIPTGTMLYVAPPPSATGVAVATGSRVAGTPGIVARDWRAFQIFGTTDPGQWSVRGTIEKLQWNPGDKFQIRGTLTIHSRQLASVADPGQVTINTPIKLDRLSDAAGRELGGTQFLSSMMTPTQFPIERSGCCRFPGSQTSLTNRRIVEGRRFEADWTSDITLPANLPAGMYRLSVGLNTSLLAPETRHFDVYPMIEGGFDSGRVQLPVITVGQPAPPRLTWMLGLNTFTNGSRGAIAQEDRGKLQVASHVMINNDRLVVPRVDARSGKPLRYRLEPFVPTIGSSNARITAAPRIAFRFPSGTLSVRVHRPDGVVDDLGSAPFVQSRSETPVSRTGIAISAASASVSDFFELTTLDPRFEYAFSRDGLHRVVMTGVIADQWGNQYTGGGTYEVYVGRTLDLDFGVMPGTPFEVNGRGSPVVVVHPPLPAEIELRVTHAPLGDVTKATVRTIAGRANRFGHYSPGGEALRFDRAGEYRIDVTARWTAADGQEWVGLAAWGSVIATPDSPLITHGRRGFDGVGKIQDQWLLVRERRAGGDHLMFPFHRGDVVWMQKDDPAAGIPKITVQDPQGAFAQRVRNRSPYSYSFEPPSLEERIAAGEIPLATTTTAGGSPSATPESINQWGYFYAFVERPGVRVREFVSEDVSSNGYWRFADNYHFQLGNGVTGDLPNDFKFQFGGAVYRESLDGYSYFGSYASFFVILPLNDSVGGRIFPPFQGNGGGPSGGPLFRLKDREIDLFFHPTGVRPGTILVQGDTASFAGYSAPTLPSKISIDVTAPSGRVRTIKGQANKVGYFYDSGYDFAVDEPGVWKANVKIVFDGATSAGQVTAPFPTGGVLGSREGEFYFYVVRGDAAPLSVAAPAPGAGQPGAAAPTQFVRPAEGPITFNITPPAGFTNVQLTYTITMPGFILEEGTTGALAYTYNAPQLAKDFPNLDQFDQDGFAGADTITISLLLSGTDAAGKRQHFARQIVIQGEEVQIPEQQSVPQPPRRRATKR